MVGSFGPPTRNSVAASKRLPSLQTSTKTSSRPFKGGEQRRQKLEALRASSNLPRVLEGKKKAAKKKEVGVEVALQTALPAATQATAALKPLAATANDARGSTSRDDDDDKPVPLDWRVLAACEVVLDNEQDKTRRQKHDHAVSQMRQALTTQLSDNKARRARERETKKEWMQSVRAEAAKAEELERREIQRLKEKRLRDREIFAQQAREQRESVEAAKAVRAAEEREVIEAARRGLLSEERRRQRERDEQKKRQEALKKAIEEERKLKEERVRAQWRDDERINRESIQRAEELERRREAALAHRDAMIKGRQRIHEQTAGKKQLEDELREQELNARYLADKAKADLEQERTKRQARQELNDKVLRENACQIAQRQVERQAANKARGEEKLRLNEAIQELRRDEQRLERERYEKQRNFQAALKEQSDLVKERKAQESVAMTHDEQALNKPLVSKVLARPERKRELVGLIQ